MRFVRYNKEDAAIVSLIACEDSRLKLNFPNGACMLCMCSWPGEFREVGRR